MAKKAPAKRDSFPKEFAAATAEIRKGAVKKAPAKRKPRAKKPLRPEIDQAIREAEALQWTVPPVKKQTLEERWDNEAARVKRNCFIAIAIASVVAFVLGAGSGVWIAGGIEIGPDNKPAPVPVPEPVKSFRVIFVKESGQTLSAEQTAIPGAKEIRDYLTAKTTQEGGQVGWREYDPQQQTENEHPTMKALWQAAKPKLLTPPCLVIEVNGKATVMPFPGTVAEAVETLKKAGGA